MRKRNNNRRQPAPHVVVIAVVVGLTGLAMNGLEDHMGSLPEIALGLAIATSFLAPGSIIIDAIESGLGRTGPSRGSVLVSVAAIATAYLTLLLFEAPADAIICLGIGIVATALLGAAQRAPA